MHISRNILLLYHATSHYIQVNLDDSAMLIPKRVEYTFLTQGC